MTARRSLTDVRASDAEQPRLRVASFYDGKGWSADDSGTYTDPSLFADPRSVIDDYARRCDDRVRAILPKSGAYFVDAGSGPVYQPDYRSYSDGFQARLCLDISVKALQEARAHLGEHGRYVLCDLAHLPLRDGCIVALLASHVLYHVPAEDQVACLGEFARVVKPGGAAVVIYSWGWRSLLMNTLLVGRQVRLVIERLRHSAKGAAAPELYFYPHRAQTFEGAFKRDGWQMRVWRSVSVPFLKAYVHEGFFGRRLLDLVYAAEQRFGSFLARFGEYPMFVLKKK